jgi:ABC-type branched-subunit amino acid transport system ATPase component
VSEETALCVEEITAGYGGAEILHGVSVRVGRGEIVTIVGPNGCGKSTLLKTIFGLLPVRRGRVRLGPDEVTGLAPDRLVRRGIGYVPQTANVFPSLTVRENLEMGCFPRRQERKERLARTFALFPLLAERARQRAGTLSGGQRQTLALARALMPEPRVLLLDEPTASLSPAMVGLTLRQIAAINAAGTAILLVEQNARQALAISHRGYVLAGGEVRLEGEARTLLDREDVRRLYVGG